MHGLILCGEKAGALPVGEVQRQRLTAKCFRPWPAGASKLRGASLDASCLAAASARTRAIVKRKCRLTLPTGRHLPGGSLLAESLGLCLHRSSFVTISLIRFSVLSLKSFAPAVMTITASCEGGHVRPTTACAIRKWRQPSDATRVARSERRAQREKGLRC